MIGDGGELRRHEQVAGDGQHRLTHGGVERVLAELGLGEVEMHVDHLHHVAAEDGEMLLGHRLHGEGSV